MHLTKDMCDGLSSQLCLETDSDSCTLQLEVQIVERMLQALAFRRSSKHGQESSYFPPDGLRH